MDGEKERESGEKDKLRKSWDRVCRVKKMDGQRDKIGKREETM